MEKKAQNAAFALAEYAAGKLPLDDEQTADLFLYLAAGLGMVVDTAPNSKHLIVWTGCQYGDDDELIPCDEGAA